MKSTAKANPAHEKLFAEAQRRHAAGRLDEAQTMYRRVLAAAPSHVKSLHYLGAALAQSGVFAEAEALMLRAVALAPDYVEAHRNLAVALARQGRLDDAIQRYRTVLALAPGDAETWRMLGALLEKTGQRTEAIDAYRRAVALRSDYVEAHNDLGAALYAAGRVDEAIARYRRLLALKPDYADAHNNLGAALRREGRIVEAVASYRQALRLNPDAETYANLGKALQDQGLLDDAIVSFERAVELAPGNAPAHFRLGEALMLKGDFTRGAAEYEWRWKLPTQAHLPAPDAPLWDGQKLPGETILLQAEQGLGDVMLFVRFAPFVRQHCARIVLQSWAPLTRLLATVPGIDAVIGPDEKPPAVAAYTPVVSLMRIFGTGLDRMPATVPYLAADPAGVAAMTGRIGTCPGLKVGLVWAAALRPDRLPEDGDERRSIGLAPLAPLLDVENVTFFSLQKGAPTDAIAASPFAGRLIDLAPQLSDFADTAAAVSHLDLVISVDTSVAHLAGALARPVWIPLHFAVDWRWQRERTDARWYPSARLYRQPEFGDWASVAGRIADDLRGAADM